MFWVATVCIILFGVIWIRAVRKHQNAKVALGISGEVCTTNSSAEDISNDESVQKGKSIVMALSDYVVVDVETTGGSYQKDGITEIALIRVRGGQIDSKMSCLVDPGIEIPALIVEKTGITNDMVKGAPKISDIIPKVIDFIGNDTVVAHNATFDIGFISAASYAISGKWFLSDFVDTLKISRVLFKEQEGHKLSNLITRFGIAQKVEHRALSDAMMVYSCYEYMKNYATDRNIELVSVTQGVPDRKGAVHSPSNKIYKPMSIGGYCVSQYESHVKQYDITEDENLFFGELINKCGGTPSEWEFDRMGTGEINIIHRGAGVFLGKIKFVGKVKWMSGHGIQGQKMVGTLPDFIQKLNSWAKHIKKIQGGLTE